MASIKFQKGNFITVPNKASLRGLPAALQIVYMWICDYADNDGKCFPSYTRLAEDAGIHRATAIENIKKLVEIGILKIEKRVRKDGGYSSNEFTILLKETKAINLSKNEICDEKEPGGESSYATTPGRPTLLPQVATDDYLYKELSINSIHKEQVNPIVPSLSVPPPAAPSSPPKARSASENEMKKRLDDDELEISFKTFWDLYPRHEARKVAWTRWKKLNISASELSLILGALEKFKRTKQWKDNGGQFIPHAATWLNQERWKDDLKIRDPLGLETDFSKFDQIKIN
jgi:hypothetical protein